MAADLHVTGGRQSIPADGTVDLWLIDLAVDTDTAGAMWTALDAGEKARADRLATPVLRRRFVAGHASVRRILAGYLGLTPATVPFVRDARGKPHVPGDPLAFNVSHSDELTVCAVASGGRLGVDIERVRFVADAERLAASFFSRRESDEIRRTPADARHRAFLDIWTRKEALLKATGEGLSRPLDSFDVTTPSAGWWMRACAPSGYVGSVAHDRPIEVVACRRPSAIIRPDSREWVGAAHRTQPDRRRRGGDLHGQP